MNVSQNQYNLRLPEHKKSSTNTKFHHWKYVRISEEAHWKSDFRRKKIVPWVGLEIPHNTDRNILDKSY